MIEGLNVAAAGMAAQQQRIAATANDLANANTTGYKPVRVGLHDLAYMQAGRGAMARVQVGAGVATVDAGRSFAQGALQQTGRPLDVAIQGDGFLRVKLPDGRQALTRDGALTLDGRGRLATTTGALVQPPIAAPAGTDAEQLKIGPDGKVSAGRKALDRLDVVTVRSPQALQSVGANAFVATAGSGRAVRAPAATRLAQGALEGSGVDVGQSMVELIDAQRSYELASKAISTADEMAQIANQVRR